MKMRSGVPRKPTGPRRVWRITAAAPHGEFVEEDRHAALMAGRQPAPVEPGPGADKTWRASSFELANGAEVDDLSNSIPGELFDELFGSDRAALPEAPRHDDKDGG